MFVSSGNVGLSSRVWMENMQKDFHMYLYVCGRGFVCILYPEPAALWLCFGCLSALLRLLADCRFWEMKERKGGDGLKKGWCSISIRAASDPASIMTYSRSSTQSIHYIWLRKPASFTSASVRPACVSCCCIQIPQSMLVASVAELLRSEAGDQILFFFSLKLIYFQGCLYNGRGWNSAVKTFLFQLPVSVNPGSNIHMRNTDDNFHGPNKTIQYSSGRANYYIHYTLVFFG